MKRQTSVRVEDSLYQEAKNIFSKFGLSFGDAVNIFLAKVAMEKGIPFDLSLPSKELNQRSVNLNKNKNIKIYNKSSELFKDLGI